METENLDVSVSPLVKWSVLFGIFLVRTLDCVPWLWGNLSVYVISYYYAAHEDVYTSVLTNWFLIVNIIVFNLGMLVSGLLGRKIGNISLILIGIVLYNGGLFLSYTSLYYSAIAMFITLGVVTGFSAGLIQAAQLELIVRWTKKYHGLATSSILSTNIWASVVMNVVVTWIVNPNDLQSDSTVNRLAVFTQKELIDKVPLSLLSFSVLSTVLNTAGFLLLRDRPGCKSIFTEMFLYLKRRILYSEKLPILKKNISQYNHSTSEQHMQDAEHTHPIRANSSSIAGVDDSNCSPGSANVITGNTSSSDVTPRESLRRKEFYTLCFLVTTQTYGFTLQNTYYKTFGLPYILDDHFLTAIGVVICAVTPFFNWLSGFSADKFGVKPTIIVVSTVFCVSASLFYLTPFNKWVYLVSCVIYGGSVMALYCLTVSCALTLFGPIYFTSILGLVFTIGILLAFIGPPIAQWLLATYGWFSLFISPAVLGFINVLVMIWGLPEEN